MFCTNGVLLRMLTSREGLQDVTHIVVDEIHERDKFADFLLIMLRELLPSQPRLRLVLMSATLDAALFTDYFNNCPLLDVPGYTHPVQVREAVPVQAARLRLTTSICIHCLKCCSCGTFSQLCQRLVLLCAATKMQLCLWMHSSIAGEGPGTCSSPLTCCIVCVTAPSLSDQHACLLSSHVRKVANLANALARH